MDGAGRAESVSQSGWASPLSGLDGAGWSRGEQEGAGWSRREQGGAGGSRVEQEGAGGSRVEQGAHTMCCNVITVFPSQCMG